MDALRKGRLEAKITTGSITCANVLKEGAILRGLAAAWQTLPKKMANRELQRKKLIQNWISFSSRSMLTYRVSTNLVILKNDSNNK